MIGWHDKKRAVTEGLIDHRKLAGSGVVQMEGVDLNTTLLRGWCFCSDDFKGEGESVRLDD